ncbi:tail fiber protein [Erythrobacter sp. F6033]|uniref:phage tail protein n=1 Tax=Erythrobacter sp. F6033 TaxID=2926401 RepID=UPI001FF3F67F|nr:tail fiber protein [Erythrobacter sp. F6033]MCK0127774.1 tail fiber protein [Erythrobacter sp. F6033]
MKIKATLAASAMIAAGMMTTPAPVKAQADPLLGQMMLFGGNFCPRGWAATNGTILAINSNQSLFSLLGTMYGGDGRTTFGLPDLRGRAPISTGTGAGLPNYTQGSLGGSTNFTLTEATMPSHSHTGTVAASPNAGDTNQPVRNSFARSTNGANVYLDGDPAINNMHPDLLRISAAGGSQSVNKVSPYLTLQWCIATQGVFPSRN